jgi:enoyl-CoA hydratase/carnithine racemase
MAAFELIEVEREGRVGIIRFNRPERLNAWTQEVGAEQLAAVAEFNADPGIASIVLTGNGRAFCSGADISMFKASLESDERNGESEAEEPRSTFAADWIAACTEGKPVIAAINGACFGMGATMALPCDVRIAGHDARISFRFLRMGVTPELGSTHFLPRLVGLGRATEFVLTAQDIDAATALDAGLVTHVATEGELMPTALEVAARIAEHPAPQIRAAKQMLQANAVEDDMAVVLGLERELLDEAFATPEHAEAVAAFVEKREPRFYAD